ncbi:MAG TPA: hypothetical protein VE134_03795 [Methanomicrobiales archaeon]|nr:hypothetical protein [Methanomicrobiales archaeon]
MKEVLTGFMESGGDWERRKSSVPGVSLIRLPPTKRRPASLAVEINPLRENGQPMKKKGVMIMSRSELAAFRTLFSSERVEGLLLSIEEVVPRTFPDSAGEREEILEI